MTLKNLLILSTFGAAILGCAQTPMDADGNPIADANPEGVICVNQADMGSRLGKRVCTTKAEREEAARVTREAIRNSEHTNPSAGGFTPASSGN
jgi:hypothetical protein